MLVEGAAVSVFSPFFASGDLRIASTATPIARYKSERRLVTGTSRLLIRPAIFTLLEQSHLYPFDYPAHLLTCVVG